MHAFLVRIMNEELIFDTCLKRESQLTFDLGTVQSHVASISMNTFNKFLILMHANVGDVCHGVYDKDPDMNGHKCLLQAENNLKVSGFVYVIMIKFKVALSATNL